MHFVYAVYLLIFVNKYFFKIFKSKRHFIGIVQMIFRSNERKKDKSPLLNI